MAIDIEIKCSQCNKKKQVWCSVSSIPDICDDCSAENENKKRKKCFQELDKLSIQKRVRKIEEWIYDFKPSSPFQMDG